MKNSKPSDIAGKALELSGMVDYQQGSVVSKTLIDKKAGTITLFAFDEGQGLSEHTAPYDAFVHVFDGQAEIYISGRQHPVSAGDVIIMPAGAPHSLKARKRFKMMLVMIRSSD
jgi:quercetin dioxygenase-like cupin family protein